MHRFNKQRLGILIGLGALVLIVAAGLLSGGDAPERLPLDRFNRLLAEKQISSAEIIDGEGRVTGETKAGTTYEVHYPAEYADEVTTKLLDAGVELESRPDGGNAFVSLLMNLLPFVLLFAIFAFVINSVQGGGSRVMQFGKAKPRTMSKDQPKTTFADVAGADEAVAELQEIKDYLAAPDRFMAIGAKVPKGVLLYGPPGTGKTLLAKAVAGEAGVPFFSISGSDFVEMFVGVGASRVRDLFEQAKSSAPAIIFMDEIDAVGRHRGAGLGGGHDEREQTLNQLLVEMDGFETTAGVILIAATNRPDILDPALLRPGRFDRQIVVDRPDLEGRKAILAVHAKDKPLSAGVDLSVLARRTPGFTGADLANLMNEAALLAARLDNPKIGMRELEEAIDRVLAGPERRTRVMSERERLVIAYHEGGHALVGHVLPGADPIHKMSIVSRGRALGWTLSLPTEDRYLVRRSELTDQLAMALGGRSAEELIFADPTTGAQDDIEKATRIARAMVTEYGMSDQLGPQQLGQRDGEVFLGRDINNTPNYSDEVATSIDSEVRRLIDQAHETALEILTQHRATLDELAAALMEHETLDTPDLMAVIGHLEPWPSAAPVVRSRRAPVRAARKASEQVAAASSRSEADAKRAKQARPARRRVPRTGPATA
ncbi:MAG TPA: ATP-dependent zinc metalloprotease FtsH [Acidimicrobiales bacterium]|nr:ATP-dependent zinc metalloprotease FtsH [Acidimicrobiales bacterium]